MSAARRELRTMAGWRIAALGLLAAASASALPACGGDEGSPRVRLVIGIDPEVPELPEISDVEVTLTASRTPETEELALCEPTTCRFPTGDGTSPVIVDFYRGDTYTQFALFRIAWVRGAGLLGERELVVPFPGSGTREVRVELTPGCVNRSCDDGQQCLEDSAGSRCVSVPKPGALGDPRLIDEGVPCGREDLPLACGAPSDADAGADGDGDGETGADADGEVEVAPPCVPLPSTCPVGMVLIPAGPFVMGSDTDEGRTDEEPEHVVTMSAYCIDQTEVTNAAYVACIDAASCTEPTNGPYSSRRGVYLYDPEFANYPVVNLRMSQAIDYCTWTGKRLPTEAEWEKACRGGCEASGDPATCDAEDERTYPWGEDPPTCWLANQNTCMVWHDATSSDNDTNAVGSYQAGAQPSYCTLDMAGNVREFVADWYLAGYYSMCPDPCTDPPGPATGSQRITRGGSFFDAGALLKCARRQTVSDDDASAQIGFRCVLAPPPP